MAATRPDGVISDIERAWVLASELPARRSTAAFERLHAAHGSAQRERDANDPLQRQMSVMVAAVDDAVAALISLN